MLERKVNNNLQTIKLNRITAIKAKMLSSKSQHKNKGSKGE